MIVVYLKITFAHVSLVLMLRGFSAYPAAESNQSILGGANLKVLGAMFSVSWRYMKRQLVLSFRIHDF